MNEVKKSKLLDICIPVLNDLNLDDSLRSIIDQGLADSVVVCISDNASENDLETIVEKYSAQLEIIYSKSEKRLSFEMNLLRSARLGTCEFVTFCGAGDEFMGQSLLHDVKILEREIEFAMLGSAQLIKNKGGIRRVMFGYDPQTDFDIINESKVFDWIFNGPLSGIGGWVVRRSDLNQAIAVVGNKIDGTKFPQIIIALFSPNRGKVIQTASTWYVATYEMDKSRMRNSIYVKVDWLELMMEICTEHLHSEIIRTHLRKWVTSNFIGFKAFGNQSTLYQSKSLAMKYGGLQSESKIAYAVATILPSPVCLALVFIKRKLLFSISTKVSHLN